MDQSSQWQNATTDKYRASYRVIGEYLDINGEWFTDTLELPFEITRKFMIDHTRLPTYSNDMKGFSGTFSRVLSYYVDVEEPLYSNIFDYLYRKLLSKPLFQKTRDIVTVHSTEFGPYAYWPATHTNPTFKSAKVQWRIPIVIRDVVPLYPTITTTKIYNGLTNLGSTIPLPDDFSIDMDKLHHCALMTAIELLEGCCRCNNIATYDNGVEWGGMNEGDVKAREHYDKVHRFLKNLGR